MQKILIIEDNLTFAQTLCDCLPQKLYHTEISLDGLSGYNLARNHTYALLIIDNALPKKLGIDIIKDLRSENIDTPILMLTGDQLQSTLIKSLKNGADNFLNKPINLLEFKTRVESILKRPPKLSKPIVVFDEYSLNLKNKKFKFKNINIQITNKTFEILNLLIQNTNTAVTKQEIMDIVWGPLDNPDKGTLDVHISNIRRIFKKYTPNKNYIFTESRKGYIFNPE